MTEQTDDDFDPAEFGDALRDLERAGILAFGNLMKRRRELAVLTMAVGRGDLFGRDLSETEKGVIGEALLVCSAMATMGNVRDALLGSST